MVIFTDIEDRADIEKSRRDALILSNETLIEGLERRLKPKRFVPHEGDYQKQGYIRLLIQALKVQNEILKDSEVEELRKELAEIKETINRAEGKYKILE